MRKKEKLKRDEKKKEKPEVKNEPIEDNEDKVKLRKKKEIVDD